jgi:hypothetical protein
MQKRADSHNTVFRANSTPSTWSRPKAALKRVRSLCRAPALALLGRKWAKETTRVIDDSGAHFLGFLGHFTQLDRFVRRHVNLLVACQWKNFLLSAVASSRCSGNHSGVKSAPHRTHISGKRFARVRHARRIAKLPPNAAAFQFFLFWILTAFWPAA